MPGVGGTNGCATRRLMKTSSNPEQIAPLAGTATLCPRRPKGAARLDARDHAGYRRHRRNPATRRHDPSMPPTACPALGEFHAMVADHLPEDADPSEVVVGIETDRGRHERGVEVAPKSMSEMTTKAITPDAAVVSLAKNLNLFRVRHAGTPAGLNGAVRVPRGRHSQQRHGPRTIACATVQVPLTTSSGTTGIRDAQRPGRRDDPVISSRAAPGKRNFVAVLPWRRCRGSCSGASSSSAHWGDQRTSSAKSCAAAPSGPG
jgi:hypothetical protein